MQRLIGNDSRAERVSLMYRIPSPSDDRLNDAVQAWSDGDNDDGNAGCGRLRRLTDSFNKASHQQSTTIALNYKDTTADHRLASR